MVAVDDFKPHNRVARRCYANVQPIADNRTTLEGAVHKTDRHRFGRVSKAPAVNAKTFFAEAGTPVKIADRTLDYAQVPEPLRLYKRRVGRIGCVYEDNNPKEEQAATNDAKLPKFTFRRREHGYKPQHCNEEQS